ncbi:NADH-quinone oxidoreductase subunit N [Candidatus Sumerlaeota bacterium]|nr:NADH-quinone oxidoreductase subunit N [Candidatus Sumerlaeota bacterium]
MITPAMETAAYVPAINLHGILPFISLLAGGMLCLAADAMSGKEGSRRILPVISFVALAAALVSFLLPGYPTGSFLENTFYSDSFSRLGCIVILVSAIATTLMGPRQVIRRNLPSGEYYTLIVFAALGMVLLALANEMLSAFVALEIMSLSLYVLTGIDRRSGKSAEASFKYFILGAFASAFFVFGSGFLFGSTRTTFLADAHNYFATRGGNMPEGAEMWAFIAFGLVFVGLCFKLSLAPFHMWAPDVYEGANTPTTLYIATGSKVAAFAFLIHFAHAFSSWQIFTAPVTFIVGLIAVASMTWGNIAAIVQSNLKRMLAYSSVAQTGYMMIAVMVLVALPSLQAAGNLNATTIANDTTLIYNAISLYLAGYTIISILAFGIAFHIGGEGSMAAYRGLFHRKPFAAVGMAIAMFSLSGLGFLPPTIGFIGKFYLFKEAVRFNMTGIAVIGILTSVIAAFYYLSLIVTMFMKAPDEENGIELAGRREERIAGLGGGDAIVRVMLATATALIFVLGLYPGLFTGLAAKAVTTKPMTTAMVKK